MRSLTCNRIGRVVACVILLVAATKLWALATGVIPSGRRDALTDLPLYSLLSIAAAYECALGILLFMDRWSSILRVGAVAHVFLTFTIYRVGLAVYAPQVECNCLAGLSTMPGVSAEFEQVVSQGIYWLVGILLSLMVVTMLRGSNHTNSVTY